MYEIDNCVDVDENGIQIHTGEIITDSQIIAFVKCLKSCINCNKEADNVLS